MHPTALMIVLAFLRDYPAAWLAPSAVAIVWWLALAYVNHFARMGFHWYPR
jgi:hypothetical protein